MRVYATPADLTEYAGPNVVDDDSPRLLARASQLVDSQLLAAVYETDANGLPLDPQVRVALRDATCAVVEWWQDTGDTTGAGAQFTESQIGTLRLKRTNPPPDLPPAAARILTTAGLLAHAPLAPDRQAYGR
jgi:hypothetical protein